MSDRVKVYSPNRKKQAVGGTLLGVGVAILGFNLNLSELGQIEIVGLTLVIAAIVGAAAYVTV